jgi:hypothetical protein
MKRNLFFVVIACLIIAFGTAVFAENPSDKAGQTVENLDPTNGTHISIHPSNGGGNGDCTWGPYTVYGKGTIWGECHDMVKVTFGQAGGDTDADIYSLADGATSSASFYFDVTANCFPLYGKLKGGMLTLNQTGSTVCMKTTKYKKQGDTSYGTQGTVSTLNGVAYLSQDTLSQPTSGNTVRQSFNYQAEASAAQKAGLYKTTVYYYVYLDNRGTATTGM